MSLNAEHISSAMAWVLHTVEQYPLPRVCSLQVAADDVCMGGLHSLMHLPVPP